MEAQPIMLKRRIGDQIRLTSQPDHAAVSGYLAAHPGVNPFPWNAMMLTHLLSAELLLVLMPFTKLAHVVLFFFDRISAVHWQLRPGAGAEALYGEEARI